MSEHGKTKHCLDCGPQPVSEFYANPYNTDRLSTYCRRCQMRRNTASREARKAQQRAKIDAGYLQRHLQRRAEEAAIEESLMRGTQEFNNVHFQDAFFFIESKPMFTGFVRLQSNKLFSWRAA